MTSIYKYKANSFEWFAFGFIFILEYYFLTIRQDLVNKTIKSMATMYEWQTLYLLIHFLLHFLLKHWRIFFFFSNTLLYFCLIRGMQQVRPPTLTSTSEQPPLFDGTTRLVPSPTPTLVLFYFYLNFACPCSYFMYIFQVVYQL